MRRHRFSQDIPFIAGVMLFVAASGCDERFGGWSRSRFERTITQRIALAESDTLDVLTRSGSIAVTGAEVADCNVVARIVGYAPTEEEAQKLAEQVEIVAQATGLTVKIRAREPDRTNNRSTSVSYTIVAPRRMNVKCDSGYGNLDVSNIEGRLDGKSSNGSIEVHDIQGPTDLNTSYGSITCRNVAGPSITLHSNNGSITCEGSSGGDLRLRSSNGRIAVSNASFGLCEARSSYGAVDGHGLEGDSIALHSSNGGVTIDDGRAKTLNLSSSYGSIRATHIVVPSLKAQSGNGSVRIICSPDAPADLDAEARSSYGSIDFTPPPGFAGEVYMSTGYGTIRTARPITITTSGEITKKRIAGTIGEGAGRIRLESNNGSVELK